MELRHPPQDLYDRVMALTTIIAQPDRDSDTFDDVASQAALAELRSLFATRESAAQHDPFLTETLADFADTPEDAIRLYRLALQQCAAFPGEPVHTKHQGIAEKLIELGRLVEAAPHVHAALRAAFATGDVDAVKLLQASLAELGTLDAG